MKQILLLCPEDSLSQKTHEMAEIISEKNQCQVVFLGRFYGKDSQELYKWLFAELSSSVEVYASPGCSKTKAYSYIKDYCIITGTELRNVSLNSLKSEFIEELGSFDHIPTLEAPIIGLSISSLITWFDSKIAWFFTNGQKTNR